MLSKKEEKIIKTYCILPMTAAVSLLMMVVSSFFWILLVMIHDIAFHGSGTFDSGLYGYLALVIFCIIFSLYGLLRVKIGQRRKFWIDLENRAAIEFHSKDYSAQAAGVVGLASAGRLMERSDNERTKTAGGLMQAAAGIGAIFLVFSIAKEMQTRSRFVADAFGLKVPKTSKVLTFVALLPIVALLAVYIPRYVELGKANALEKAAVSQTISAMESVFEEEFPMVMSDDPYESYLSSGYDVTAYLHDFDEPLDFYMKATVKESSVYEITYKADIDITADAEENAKTANEAFAKLNSALQKCQVDFKAQSLLDVYSLPDDFVSQFKDGGVYEEFSVSENTADGCKIFVMYSTDSREEYNEYSSSYIYMTIEYEE